MQNKDTILLTGASGLVGSAFKRRLEAAGFVNILAPSHAELDLKDDTAVSDYFELHKPAHVFLAAAKVGGILANETYPADFIYDNLKIQNAVLHQSFVHNVTKLLFLGSSCIYPKQCPQPMQEDALLSGKLEHTNEPYAIAKIAGIELCWAYNRQYGTRFLPVMPTNLFGPNDNFDLETSHALPALLRKFHEAHVNKQEAVSVWGTGRPRREFLHVDDLAEACLFLMQQEDKAIAYQDRPLLNIGTGEDVTIKELAELIKEIVGFQGTIVFDTAKPDGTPRKLLDISRISHLGWRPRIPLKQGIRQTYEWYRKHKDHIKQ
jgi:GDP-L-fucose synthase